MKFESLELNNGHALQLQINNASGMPERYACQLVGHIVGRSVLVTVPKKAGHLLRFRSGQKVVVRFIVDNGAGVFITQVDIQTADPYPLLHLSYPDKVTFKGIRNATRIKVSLPATLVSVVDQRKIPCRLLDLSESGCRLEAAAESTSIGERVSLIVPVDIQGIARELVIEGAVRSQIGNASLAVETTAVGFGVEFTQMDDDIRLALLAYLYGEVMQPPRS